MLLGVILFYSTDHKNVVCTDLKWVRKIINNDSYIYLIRTSWIIISEKRFE